MSCTSTWTNPPSAGASGEAGNVCSYCVIIAEVKVATDVHGPFAAGPVQTSMRLAQYLQYPGEYLSS